MKKNFVGEKSSKVLNNRDSGRSQDVTSKYNVTTTTKSSKGLTAIKSSSIDATSGPSSHIEAMDKEHQVSCSVMDPFFMAHLSSKIVCLYPYSYY